MDQKPFGTSSILLFLIGLAAMLLPAGQAMACNAPVYLTDDLTPNVSNSIPADTLQVVLFYDGAAPANVELRAQYIDNTSTTCWMTIQNLDAFTTEINTREYDLNGAQLTGNFEVVGATTNGVIDGLAFGLFWKDSGLKYHIVKSNQTGGTTQADFVGMWPLMMNDATFAARTPQITDGDARWQARKTIGGAALVGNGYYNFAIH